MGKSCCITGHRKVYSSSYLHDRIYRKIEMLIRDNGVEYFYDGGSYGFDYIAGIIVCELKEKYPSVKLHMVLPCFKEEQTKYWSFDTIAKYDKLLSQADSVEYVSGHYYDGCMRDRNERLVDLGRDYCLCYVKPRAFRSGSAQTVRMAMARGLEIVNVAFPNIENPDWAYVTHGYQHTQDTSDTTNTFADFAF